MFEIKSERDLVIVPVSYFKGMEGMLQSLAELVEVRNLDAMEQFIYLREWLNASKVDKETRKMHPNLQWDNIHLLLPLEENCDGQCML